MSRWIKLNSTPVYDEKCAIDVKFARFLCPFYNSIEKEIFEMRDGNYYFYNIYHPNSWVRKKDDV